MSGEKVVAPLGKNGFHLPLLACSRKKLQSLSIESRGNLM